MSTITLDDYNDKDKNSEIRNCLSPTNIKVYFDGLCQPVNPGGTACYSFIVKTRENTIHRESGLAAYDSTNNVAEYTGAIKTLGWLIEHNLTAENIVIRGDSRLVINQLKRIFQARALNIISLYLEAQALISKFKCVELEWIPREENKEADKLACRAYEEIVHRRMGYEQTSL